jgi:poly(3-hydroxybutyrate) depolymerase
MRLPIQVRLAAAPLAMNYFTYQALVDGLQPWQLAAGLASSWLNRGLQHWGEWPAPPGTREAAALGELVFRLKLTHERPGFGIDSVQVEGPDGGRLVRVREKVVQRKPFGTLLQFEREDLVNSGNGPPLPRVLVVAPLSGHFATLLADTARTLLADHDVYITDWHNARRVPLDEGGFGLAEYAQHVIDFVETLGPGTHLLAVCQPCVPVLAAVALMAQRESAAQPLSMTLMAGPVDCRINPTKVNELATSKPISWFEQNLISRVPMRYPGAGRRVYPGFMQLSAFISMNPGRHRDAFADLYRKRVAGEDAAADTIADFYDEYLAVNDLPAEFFLETVAEVFQDYSLARGEMILAGERIDTRAIRRTALLTVEGERDDICSIGQTVAAHDLCSGIKPYLKTHHVQLGVGHYGVFSGKRWRTQIYPRVREMIYSMN